MPSATATQDPEVIAHEAYMTVWARGKQGPPYVKPHLRGAASVLWDTTDHEAIICGPAETGKTWAGLSRLNAYMWDHPGARGVICRKVRADMGSTVLETWERILGNDPRIRIYGGEEAQWYGYPNGSRVWVLGMDKPGKILSGEFDFIYINQAEEIAFDAYQTLLTRTTGRGSSTPFTQVFGDCNPDKIGHWILERQKSGHLKLLYSHHEDNPTLYTDEGVITEQGKRTMEVLDALEGIPYKRLRLGQWGVPAGLIYDCFDAQEHVIKPFRIPDDWPRFGGLDFGGVNTAALLVAKEPNTTRYYAYREYHAGNRTAGQHKDALLQGEPSMPDFVGGSHSEGQWRNEFRNAGLPIREPRVKDVEVGIQRGYGIIRRDELRVFDTCRDFISQLQSYSRKLDSMGEPTEEIADKATYHVLDAWRYLAVRLADTKRVGRVL